MTTSKEKEWCNRLWIVSTLRFNCQLVPMRRMGTKIKDALHLLLHEIMDIFSKKMILDKSFEPLQNQYLAAAFEISRIRSLAEVCALLFLC